MAEISLPYGKNTLCVQIPANRLKAVLTSKAHMFSTEKGEKEIVLEALENPIDSPKLRNLASGKNNIVIITSDHTRPVPSHITLPAILREIRMGNPDANISMLIANGFHRSTTLEEMISKYGKEIVEKEKFVMHISTNEEDMISVGTLPSGGKCELNRLAVNADLLIADGFIEPHFFAGFSGGRKSILPGVASKRCILANHCAEFIDSDFARTGILEGNPLHTDMLYAAEKAKLAFILNVVINSEQKIINAFAGNRVTAHLKGCSFVNDLAMVESKPADIVITTNGGYPLDQNIYQAVKSMTAAEATCREGGVIIIASECCDGHGGEAFYNWFKNSSSPQDVMDKIMLNKRDETVPDQWEAQVLSRVLIKHKVIMVTEGKNHKIVEDMYMTPAFTMEEALKIAEGTVGKDSSITVIPDGISVIVR